MEKKDTIYLVGNYCWKNLRVLYSVIFMLLISGIYASTPINSLDGTWILDSARIVKSRDNSMVEITQLKQKSYFGAYDQLKFQGNELTIDNLLTGNVQITDDTIAFSFTPIPIEAEYKIKDGVLFLERRISFKNTKDPDNSDTYIVLIQYKLITN